MSAEFSQGGAVVDPGICKGVADLNLSGAATEGDPMIFKVGKKMLRAKRAKKIVTLHTDFYFLEGHEF